MGKKSVCIVGSGNWGSAIAKILGRNVQNQSEEFDTTIIMYMYEEMVNGRKLTEIFNTEHENVKYLPGIKIPENVIASPDMIAATKDADILIFVLPHQFVKGICDNIKDTIKKSAIAVSLIKGVSITESGVIFISDVISKSLGIPCSAISGANLATEVAQEQFCESSIGCDDEETGHLLKDLFEAPYFRLAIVKDRRTLEMCGALKNIVAIGAGIVDGLECGDNTKAAVLRLGLMEMVKFAEMYVPGTQTITFFESCGVADLVATCHGGRNRMLGENVVKSEKTVKQLEKELLKGQSFQGPLTARELFDLFTKKDIIDRFPLFVAVHKICQREMHPRDFIECLRNHPEHL